MYKITFAFLFLFSFAAHAEPLKVNSAAEAILIMNADTGVVIYEKNGWTPYHPASITKVATALYTLKKKGEKLDVMLTAEQDDVGSVAAEVKLKPNSKIPSYRLTKRASHVGIKAGEKMSLKDLLYGLMVASGDDAANMIARYVGGTIPTFMEELNIYLKEIGCKNTTFMNPHGLDDYDHKTTAYDIAVMTKEGLKNPMFRKLISTVKYERPKTNKQDSTTWVQTNRLLRKGPYFYPKAIGVKTGYETMADHNLVAAATHEGRTIILVLLHSKERNDLFQDSIAIFDTLFKQKKMERTLIKSGTKPYSFNIEGLSKPVPTYSKNEVTIQYYPAEEPEIKAQLTWDKVSLPIVRDQKLGEIELLDNNNSLVAAIPLFASEDGQMTWMHRLKHILTFGNKE